MSSSSRIFILSPANLGGQRARYMFNPNATFDLAQRLHTREGAPLGDVFSFVSGLYFRGKLAYARAFARPPELTPGILVITPCAGLLSPDLRVRIEDLERHRIVDIDLAEPRYTKPFRKHARALARAAGDAAEIVLLGSIATPKYVDLLREAFG